MRVRWPILNDIANPALRSEIADKAIWRTMQGNTLQISTSDAWIENSNVVTWSKHVWFTQCIPKHAFVLWLAVKIRLQTQERILKWNPGLTSKCPLWL